MKLMQFEKRFIVWILAILLANSMGGITFAQEKRVVVPNEGYRSSNERILGSGYRDLWTTPIEVGVLDLHTFAGGLRPVMRVGGLQTASLAMVGKDGRSYTFRSLIKRADAIVPKEFLGTQVEWLIRDQMSAQNPAAALTVSVLSKAIGVLEVETRLVIMPDDPLLGEFREDFKNILGTIAEYPTTVSEKSPGFHGATDLVSTVELWELYRKDPNQWPDAEMYLKARLLDLLVGDWDRHHGQWGWAKIPGKADWQPIPEDRDQALSNYDGMVMGFGRLTGLPQFVKFEAKYPSIYGLSFNAWPVDRLVLPSLEWSVWERVTTEVKAKLHDQVIEEAVSRMPGEYREAVGEEIATKLKARRDLLMEASRSFYLHLAGEVDVIGTDLDEIVRLKAGSNRELEVVVGEIEGVNRIAGFYKRKFSSTETNEVRIYLLNGTTRIEVESFPANGPRVFVIGRGTPILVGETKHIHYVDLNARRKIATHTDIKELYGVPDPNEAATWLQTIDWGSTTIPVAIVDYRSGAGWIFGGGFESTQFSFDKVPYGTKHFLLGGYAIGANQPVANYSAEFRRRQHKSFLSVSAKLSGLENLRYYGLGNETDGSEGADRYRIKSLRLTFFPAWTWANGPVFELPSFTKPPERTTIFRVGPILKYGSATTESGSILGEEQPYGIGKFGQLGVSAVFHHDGRKTRKVLEGGFKIDAQTSYYFPAWDVRSRFGNIGGFFGGYIPIGSNVLLATSIDGTRVFGDYPFFEAAYLGGRGSIRGYEPNRFAGDGSVLGTAELRVRVYDLRLPIPGTIGVFGGSEVGRVFLDGEESKKWHPAAGGGVFFEMLRGLSVFSLSGWKGREDYTVQFKAGFEF
jgi:hypothetical protein